MFRFSALINLPLTFRDYRREHDRKFVCFLKTTLVLYTGFFCTFANITDVEGIYKGVVSVFFILLSIRSAMPFMLCLMTLRLCLMTLRL